MNINNKTKLVACFANKQNSLGTIMHNAAYEALGLNYVYIPITTDNIKDSITAMRALNIRGSSISIPFKQEVMKYIDMIDETANTIGAVNTVSNNNGVLTGFNSDWIGSMNALKEVINPKDKNVIVIGTGGVARALVFGLVKERAKVKVFGRNTKNAKDLAKELGAEQGFNISDIKNYPEYDIVINATSVGSVGSNENESIVDESYFKPNTVAMDVISMPVETKFLKLAKQKSAQIVSGYRMLIHQAIVQFEIFTGKKAPFNIMETAVLEEINNY